MKNQNNYKFSTRNTAEIIRWIDNQLLVSWVEANPALKGTEKALIQQYCPIINTIPQSARGRRIGHSSERMPQDREGAG